MCLGGRICAVGLSRGLPIRRRGRLLAIWGRGRLSVRSRRRSAVLLRRRAVGSLRRRRSVRCLLRRWRAVRGLLRGTILLGGWCTVGSLRGGLRRSAVGLLWRRTVGLRCGRLSIPLGRWLLVVLAALGRRGAVGLLRRWGHTGGSLGKTFRFGSEISVLGGEGSGRGGCSQFSWRRELVVLSADAGEGPRISCRFLTA